MSGMNKMMNDVLKFWFEELSTKQWFAKDLKLDARIRERFLNVHTAAVHGELFDWRGSAEGRLAEIIVLDQFSRNIFRGEPESFAFDGMALVLAQEAVLWGVDLELPVEKRAFLYMPYMHSESLKVHEEAVRLFDQKGMELNYDFELRHRKIIERFGRYPHRNEILGRESTAEEIEFLKQPGSGF